MIGMGVEQLEQLGRFLDFVGRALEGDPQGRAGTAG